MIYHVMAEWESFSQYSGGAISRDVANLMRFDESRVVVAPRADDTWGFATDRVLTLPQLGAYARLRGKRSLPSWMSKLIIRYLFRPLLSRVGDGDVVWVHDEPFFSEALEAPVHFRRAKLVHHSHSSISSLISRGMFRPFVPDAVVFVSEAMRQECSRLFQGVSNTYVIHNGVDDGLFYPLRGHTPQNNAVPTVLYVGRLVPEKGIHVLSEAMRILRDRGVAVACKVVGASFSGGSRVSPYMKKLAAESPSNVEFLGHRFGEDLAREFRHADIFCCPSIWQEPFGNVNIEAMASGVPVVATRVGGIPEIAAEGGVVLVEPGSPISLADAIDSLVTDRDLRIKLACEAYKSAQRRFTWSAIYKQVQHVTESMR